MWEWGVSSIWASSWTPSRPHPQAPGNPYDGGRGLCVLRRKPQPVEKAGIEPIATAGCDQESGPESPKTGRFGA